MKRWRDRVAVVTGASSGIGHEIVRELAGAGMRVHAWARREERMQGLVTEGLEGRVTARSVDLRDVGAIERAFAAVRERDGGVDVMVNNAGLGFEEPLTSGDTERWREMLDVNVLALCVCTREAVDDMRARGDDGHVVHISSMAAHRVPPGSGVYSATKYAVRSLTEALRRELRELGSGVRVSAVSPGFVETGFHANYYADEERAKEAYSRFRVLDAKDVARAVTYLLSQPSHVQVHDVLMRPTEQVS
jgi:NADP-dependent 3-hydroxy acid dehydrogenase YdfG